MDSHKVNENGVLYMEKELLLPYTHILQVSGKQMRIKIIKALNHWLKVPEEEMQNILNLIQMTHVASLLIDDIQDDSKLRRGLPAAHCIYGIPVTLNAAYHTLFLAASKAYDFNPKVLKILAETFLRGVQGQGMELYWRENLICPTEEEYMNMVALKTGYMFRGAHRVMQLYSDNKGDYSKIVNILGIYFQVRDDYCNLSDREGLEEWPGKEDVQAIKDYDFCEDITEGKFSLSVIHALSKPEGKQILNILKQRTRDIQLKEYCLSIMEKLGSLQYTRDVLAQLDREARAEVTQHGGNPEMIAVLDEMLSWNAN